MGGIGIWIYYQKPSRFRFIMYDVGLGRGTDIMIVGQLSRHGRSSRSSRPDFHHEAA
jgi:hypothetical protein